MPSALSTILSTFGVDRKFWTQILRCSDRQLNDWFVGRRELPHSVAETLSEVIGVPADVFSRQRKEPIKPETVLPPLWLKARQSGVDEAGYRAIASARLLAARYEEVLSLVEPSSVSPRLLINEIKEAVDPQRPASVQGALAARAFLNLTTLGKGAVGIGEVIRGFLRARGILILETPIDNAQLEGFCVPVGSEANVRPCIVANSYRTTWFRRNSVILHEFAHAIFDLDAVNGVFDLSARGQEDIAEQRADSFALHALVPQRLLTATLSRQRLHLKNLDEAGMAELISATHAEQGLFIKAAREYGLVSDEEADRLKTLRVARELRARSIHARGLAGLPREALIYPEVLDWGPRLTSFPLEGLRLPIPFVRLVLQALENHKINSGKAAELLMADDKQLSLYGIGRPIFEEVLAS
jgi:Zn-dependent peptidase ImmA (M78 family)